ncbi:ABC transporter substrate-binding protein [Pseudonocardia sp. TRM90224]|uniref:ABC transporter substrate-binding protein n=1 Tax=Pseudonocardia sp. TRM90224 TaxID=2812678 RepID=UPI001E4BE9AC|nr:ABC transporter substrate-binding protein [Pseudonocardia sp. TRM90224]
MTTINRRRFLAGTAAALGLAAAGCASPVTATPGRLTLWYWTGGLATTVLTDAAARFAAAGLEPVNVGFDNLRGRLLATLSGGAYIPDMTMLSDDIARYFGDADQFVDLNTLGAARFEGEYLPWKWKAGTTPDGRLMGFPIDTGPAALYYRADLFAKAGLPSEPDDVAAAVHTWEDFFAFGKELQKTQPGAVIATDSNEIFQYALAQGPKKYLDVDGRYIGDQDHVRRAWDLGVRVARLGLSGAFVNSTDRQAAWNSGVQPAFISPTYTSNDVKKAAPSTAGNWRVCRSPGGPSNAGGSFIAITRYCPDPQSAFDAVSWILSPANQARHYLDAGLFPSALDALTDPAVRVPDSFFGGQTVVDVFAESARGVPQTAFSYMDIGIRTYFQTEIKNVEQAGKDPDQAWNDAQTLIYRLLKQSGVER